MSSVWLALGVALVILVAVVLFGFFYWRPRAQARVTAASEALVRELHGRPPLLMAPAQCRKAEARDANSLKGLGVLALTEEAVLYAGKGDRVLILPRATTTVASVRSGLRFTCTEPAARITVNLAEPAPWAQALRIPQG